MDTQKRIRKLMEERKWTDYRLAKEANLSHSTVTNMFNRNNAPTLPTLEAVCRAFGITLAQFFAEGEEAQLTEEQQKLFSKCFLASNFPHFHRYDSLKSALYIHAVSKNINTFPKNQGRIRAAIAVEILDFTVMYR